MFSKEEGPVGESSKTTMRLLRCAMFQTLTYLDKMPSFDEDAALTA